MQKLKVKKQKGDERLVWGKWEEEEKREGGREVLISLDPFVD